MIVGLQEWKYSEAAVEIDVTTGAKSAQQSLDDHAAKCCFEPNLPIFCFAANVCFMQIDLILDEAPQLENQRPFECGGS